MFSSICASSLIIWGPHGGVHTISTLHDSTPGTCLAAFSTSIALEKGQTITQDIVQNVYGDYFQLLTVLAVVMVAIAMAASLIIRKMLDAAKESDTQAQPVEIEAGVEVQS